MKCISRLCWNLRSPLGKLGLVSGMIHDRGPEECLASRPSGAWTGHPRWWGNWHQKMLGWATRPCDSMSAVIWGSKHLQHHFHWRIDGECYVARDTPLLLACHSQ